MAEQINTVSLSGSGSLLSRNETDAYRVLTGSALVFIVPLRKWGEGRKSFIYEAAPGDVIPAFCFRDRDAVEWRFCITAMEQAEIEIIDYGATKILKDKFAKKIRLHNYQQEGYASGLVEQYKANILKEDILIRRNRNLKNNTFSDTLASIAASFEKKKLKVDTEFTGNSLYDSVQLICAKLSIPIAPIEKMKEACGEHFTVADIARISHFSYRKITLGAGWEREDSGPFVVFTPEGRPFACLPGRMKASGAASYLLCDPAQNSVAPLTRKVAESISPQAFMLYRPLPAGKLEKRDLFSFCRASVSNGDLALFAAMVIITAVIGLIIPIMNQKLFDDYIPYGDKGNLLQILMLLASFMLANAMISVVKNLCNFRITSKINYEIGNAVFDRVLNLPESFFRGFESADLTKRVMSIGGIVTSVANVIISGSISLVYLTVYFVKMLSYSGKLTGLGAAMTLLYGVIYFFINQFAVKHSAAIAELDGEVGSRLFQYLTGISKIRIAGVEDRAIYEYIKPYIRLCERSSKRARLSLISSAVSAFASLAFTLVFYSVAAKENDVLTVGSFAAFTSLFGMFEAGALEIISGLASLRALRPTFRRFAPIMQAQPEFDAGCELPGEITGAVEINNVSFAYAEDEPKVLKDINLTIRPGEYIGIVGPSGSGKSTLMKLLLGFEKPTTGKIYYDNKDIEKLDKRELRKKMGVVLQNGRLISGSIFDNITITAPDATLDQVNRVIDAVGLRSDISKMPMGIYTMLNEESNTISGGQQQRILIARAIISSPKLLLFDEATSALDNLTQSMVCDTLDQLHVTRLIIAHRLSTIMNCDRIIVLDKGRIVEEGTCDALMAQQGVFYQLAIRQIS